MNFLLFKFLPIVCVYNSSKFVCNKFKISCIIKIQVSLAKVHIDRKHLADQFLCIQIIQSSLLYNSNNQPRADLVDLYIKSSFNHSIVSYIKLLEP